MVSSVSSGQDRDYSPVHLESPTDSASNSRVPSPDVTTRTIYLEMSDSRASSPTFTHENCCKSCVIL